MFNCLKSIDSISCPAYLGWVKTRLTAIFVFVMAFCSFGQQAPAYQPDQALEYAKRGQFDSALYYLHADISSPGVLLFRSEILWKKGELQKSLNELDLLSASTNESMILHQAVLLKGKLLFSMGEPVASVSLMDSLLTYLEDPRNISEALNTKSKSLIWAGESVRGKAENLKADSIYEANSLNDWVLKGDILNVAGILSYFDGNFDQAIQNFEEAIEAKKHVLSTTHPDIISLFGNTGVMYKNKLEYDKALQYYYYELENYSKSIGEVHPYVATSYQNIGGIYHAKGEYDLALSAFKKALQIRRKRLGEDNPLTLDIYEWLGNITASQEDYEGAKALFEKVLAGRKKHLDEVSHFVSLAHFNIAEADYHLGNYAQAYDGFLKAADIGEKVYDKKNADLATIYNGMAMSLDELGKSAEARRRFFLALETAMPDYEWNHDLTQVPRSVNYLRFDEVFTSLYGLARSYQRSSKVSEWKVALIFVEAAKKLLETHKHNFTIKSDKITLGRSTKKLADLAIKINHQLYQQEVSDHYLSSIFNWNEYVKASILLSTISDQRAREISGIPDSLLQMELSYRLSKDSVRSLIAEGNKGEMRLDTRLLELEQDHERFIREMESNYPEYAEKKYGLRPSSVNEIISSLDTDREAIVQYFVTGDNQLFASILKKGGHELVVTNCADLGRHVEELRNSLSAIDEQGFVDASRQLYNCIIKPFAKKLEGIDQLTIVTDGILGYVPFELLPDSSGTYLMEHFLIKYDLSSTLLARRAIHVKPGAKLLAYAPQFQLQSAESVDRLQLVRSEILSALPGAEKEVKTIGEVYRSDIRIGAEATETSFRNEASYYDILHLATHSVVNTRDPAYTRLLFSKDENDDGQLYIYELENISLNASLVTLSACNTGVGKIAEGEGVMSLARSFRSVGVPSVVMSLWPASDKSTPELMAYFYENLHDGLAKDVALNNARKKYLENAQGKARHPFYWGGFVLVGDNTPISESTGLIGWIISMILIIPVILVLYRKRKKRS